MRSDTLPFCSDNLSKIVHFLTQPEDNPSFPVYLLTFSVDCLSKIVFLLAPTEDIETKIGDNLSLYIL